MSLYQVQQCLFDNLRVLEKAPPGERPAIATTNYELTDDERRAVQDGDVDAFSVMGVHPVIINAYCRSQGYKRADYRPLFKTAAATAASTTRRGRWQTS